MKKHRLLSFSALGLVFLFLVSCTKINEPTTLGGDLIPGVDNITTFDTTLSVVATNYFIANDTTRFFYSDFAAIGKMNDPVFGTTTANAYFNVGLPTYGANPFGDPSTTKVGIVDSVILSLSYQGGYGDTANSFQTVSVFEISQSAGFRNDSVYRFTVPDFATTGSQLGSKTFLPKSLTDSIQVIRGQSDTTKVANVLRIPLTTTLGNRFALYDTSNTFNGGFRNDSIFQTLFRGIAIKAQSSTSQGALSYFDLTDQTNTSLTVYYHAIVNGVADTALKTVSFYHTVNGQANVINRQNGGDYAAYASPGTSPNGSLYIQSTPGSYVVINIPALDAFKTTNKVIHRAELIINKVPSSSSIADKIFTPPARLFLDRLSPHLDTAFIIPNDMTFNTLTGGFDLTSFGGDLRSDDTYHFTLTRHVQGIVTRGEPNLSLRLSAPLHPIDYELGASSPTTTSINVLSQVANGRVVVAGSNYTPDLTKKMRLRIVYSKL